MTSQLEITPETLIDQSAILRQEQRQLLKPFWLAVTVLFLVEAYTLKSSSVLSIIGAILIACAALFPFYLWCSGKALGMPIFPIFALTYLWTHALPLVSTHPRIIIHSPNQRLSTSFTVVSFLLLSTFVWFQFVKLPPAILKSYRVLDSQSSDPFFLVVIISSIIFNICSAAGLLSLDGGTFAVVRSVISGLSILAVFVLFYRFGARKLTQLKSIVLLILLIFSIIESMSSLLLVNALSIFFLAAIAFVVGRKKIPWLPIILVLVCISFLQAGKNEMRMKYWAAKEIHLVQPQEYPTLYKEWIGYSFKHFDSKAPQQASKQPSLVGRASLIQMLLLAQVLTPKYLPYLSGKTYKIIPQLLVPRILNKNKIRSHEGTYVLNIYYRLQNHDSTLHTTIGWGLLSEAYANFGFLGCAGLSIILGATYGQVSRWSLNTPLLSSRSLLSVLMLSFAFQAEWTAGVYVAALFQSVVVLGIITFGFMKNYTNREALFIHYG